LYDKITSNQKYPTLVKTIVGDSVYPKTTNTFLTVYYSSYINTVFPQATTNDYYNQIFHYFCTGEGIATIVILIVNSTLSTPKIVVGILKTNGQPYKEYVATQDTPKVIVNLTTDIPGARPGVVEITNLKFCKSENSTRSADQFYQDCVNILGNAFISYSYKD
jgi:hypothetical protein